MKNAPDAILKSLSDATRRSLFECLSREGEQTVRMLTDRGTISQPAVSKHLRILKNAGMVRARQHGRETHYSAQPKALVPLVNWITFYSRFWHNRFDRLEELLKRMDP